MADSCKFIKADGVACRARPLSGRETCWFHSEDKVAVRKAASAAGGAAGREPPVLPADAPQLKLRSAADLAGLIEVAVNKILRGQMSRNTATALGFLAGMQQRILAQTLDEQRIAALEAAVTKLGARVEK